MTSWGDYQSAIDQLLVMPLSTLCIYDHDLTRLSFESVLRSEALKEILTHSNDVGLRIAVRDARHLQEASPRLLNLLRNYGHRMEIRETPENLAHLRDGMFLADKKHGVILFDYAQARSKIVLDDLVEIQVYQQRFEEIWDSGGYPVSATTIGL